MERNYLVYSAKCENYHKNRKIFSGTGFLTVEGYPPTEREYITLEELRRKYETIKMSKV